MVNQGQLWELADRFEERSKNKSFGPIGKWVWKQAHDDLVARLGERVLPEPPHE